MLDVAQCRPLPQSPSGVHSKTPQPHMYHQQLFLKISTPPSENANSEKEENAGNHSLDLHAARGTNDVGRHTVPPRAIA